MRFSCRLRRPSSGSAVVNDPDADAAAEFDASYDTLVMTACHQLGETDAGFDVSGLGTPSWGTDVSYDLSVVLEQLPDLLAQLRAGTAGEIDFYSQGFERVISFVPEAGEVVITSRSKLDPATEPQIDRADRSELIDMFVTLAQEFAISLELTGSRFAVMEPFASWRNGEICRDPTRHAH